MAARAELTHPVFVVQDVTGDKSGASAPKAVALGTRERLLQAAMELFTTRGYEATSLADVLHRAEVNSGSLYYFFKTKEDLLLAGLAYFQAQLYRDVMAPAFARTTDPIERIFAVLADYRERLLTGRMEYWSPLGKLALEVGGGSAPARKRIAENFEAWRSHIRLCLDDASDRLPPSVDRDALASFVLTVVEGAMMQAGTHRDLALYDASIAQLRTYFQYLMAG